MKKLAIFFICFFGINVFSKNATVKYTTGNVTVFISCFTYREEINKGLIIAESVRELSQINNFTDSIQLYLHMTTDTSPVYSFKKHRNIFLYTQSNNFHITEHLKIIEYAIIKKGKVQEKLNFDKIISTSNSDQINQVLKIRIDRPAVSEELKNRSIYTYYYQNEKYYFYNIETNEPVMTVNSVYLMTTVAYFRPLIFVDRENFYYMNLEDTLKPMSFPAGIKLTDDYRMKEISHFVILYVYQKNIEDFNLIILDLDKDALKEISTLNKGLQY